jgi:hypothetical protein
MFSERYAKHRQPEKKGFHIAKFLHRQNAMTHEVPSMRLYWYCHTPPKAYQHTLHSLVCAFVQVRA